MTCHSFNCFSIVNDIWNKSYVNCGNEMKKWLTQWTQFMQLRKEAWKRFRTSTGFEPVTSRYRCDALATELWSHWRWSRSIVGSYFPVREISVNDIWNKSYIIYYLGSGLGTIGDSSEQLLHDPPYIAFILFTRVKSPFLRVWTEALTGSKAIRYSVDMA